MSEYFVGTTGTNNQTTFESLTTSEVLDDLQLNTTHSPTFNGLTVGGDIILGANHIGRDGDNYITFVDDNVIKFRANGATQAKLYDGVFAPQTDSDVDIGTNSVRFANGYFDTLYGDGSNLTNLPSGADNTKLPLAGGTMTGHILLNNAIELRSKDTSSNVKTIARVNSSNQLEYGWSGAGPVKFMGGGSYTERMRVHTDGNVGIGTTSPDHKLHVKGDITIDNESSSEPSMLHFNATNKSNHDPTARINFWEGDSHGNTYTGSHAYIEYNGSTAGGGDGYLAIGGSTDAGANSDIMVINRLGRVGIGAAVPKGRLHVLDGTAGSYTPDSEGDTVVIESSVVGGISLIGSGSGSAQKQKLVFGTTGDTTGAVVMHDPNNSVMSVGTTTASNYLRFLTGNGTEAMRLAADGKVGIGTGSTALYNAFTVNGNANLATGDGSFLTFNNGDANITVHYNNADSVVGRDLSFKTYKAGVGNTEKMRIDRDGNVGIGDTTPSYKLDVNGTLRAVGAATFDSNVTIAGNLTVNGTTTTINSTTISVDDKNIELGSVSSPDTSTADGGGITLLAGSSESDHKTIKWINSTDAWTFNTNVSASGLDINGAADISGNLEVGEYILRSGQGSNYHRFLASRQIFVVGNASSIDLNNGTSTFGATGGATTLQGSSLLLDSADAIVLDADDDGSVKFKDAGTEFGRIYNAGSNFYIKSIVSDKDLVFVGNDGGTAVEALRLDMSNGGNATFAGTVTATSLIKSGGTSSEFLKADGSVDSSAYLTSLGTAIVDGDFTANGLMKRTGAGTYTSITDNSSNWNTAYTHTSATNNPHSVTASQVGAYTSGATDTLLAAKAPLASPALTGNPTAPTQSSSENSTKIATTAYVKSQGYITSANGGNAGTLDGYDSTQFLRSDANDTMSGTLTFSGASSHIALQQDHVVFKRFDVTVDEGVTNSTTAYLLLCRNAPYNDVNGTVTMDRTSGLRHACSVDIVVSAGTGTNPAGTCRSIGTAGGSSPSYELVTLTYSSNSFIALKITNPDAYYETSGHYFTGRLATTDTTNAMQMIAPASVSSVSDFDSNPSHQINGNSVFHDGYHPNADTLTTARTISLGTDLSGSASFNGGSDITINAQIAANAVGTSEIADGAVTAIKLATNSVTATKIAGSAVGASELNVVGNGSATQFLRSDGDGTFTWATPTDTNTQLTSSEVRANISGTGLISYNSSTGVISTTANNYSLPEATATVRGGIELFSNTDQSVAANTVSSTAGRTYGIQLNSAGQAVVNVPWSDTNTDTNTFRTVTAGGNTLGSAETLALTAGSNVSISEAGGQVTISSTDTNTVYTHPTHAGDDINIDTGALTGATVISDLDFNITTNTLGHVTDANGTVSTRTLTAANLGISAPNAPASASVAIVGETVEVTFAASTTSNIDSYLVYSSIDGSDYGLISVVPPDDFAASMSIIDNAFDETGTQAYRVYAMKYGILSSAATASVSYAVSSAEPTSMSVVNLNNAYYVQWNPPSSNARFVTAYNVYKHEHATQGSLSRSSASLVYSGMNTNYMYQISGTNNNNFHQFWVETTIA